MQKKSQDFLSLQKYFEWFPLDTVKNCTNQLALNIETIFPFHKHAKAKAPQFNCKPLAELFANDFYSVQKRHGEVFLCTTSQ